VATATDRNDSMQAAAPPPARIDRRFVCLFLAMAK
jgi:hypothetical protein